MPETVAWLKARAIVEKKLSAGQIIAIFVSVPLNDIISILGE